jgi:hypothetical protein
MKRIFIVTLPNLPRRQSRPQTDLGTLRPCPRPGFATGTGGDIAVTPRLESTPPQARKKVAELQRQLDETLAPKPPGEFTELGGTGCLICRLPPAGGFEAS